MQVRDLFDHAALRAVLTVSESELPDSTLTSFNVYDDVASELDSRVSTWQSLSDEKQLRELRLFAKYFAGSVVATNAPVFVLTQETDGNNEAQRSNKEGFRFLAGELLAKAEKAMARLNTLLGVEAEADPLTLLDRVPPNRDIITEPRSTT